MAKLDMIRGMLIEGKYFIIAILVFVFLNSRKYDLKYSLDKATFNKILLKFSRKKYWVIRDVFLEDRGKKIPVDCLILSEYGIFVIDIENYEGEIYGSESSRFWLELKNEEKVKFANPLNKLDRTIEALINLDGEFVRYTYLPIVIFPNIADFKFNENNVIYFKDFRKTVKSHRKKVMTKRECRNFFEVLREKEARTYKRKNEHGFI